MPINGMQLLKNATGITVTGGTATTYQDDGLDVKNGLHVVDTTETNFLLRPHGTFKNKAASQLATGKFTKGVRSFNFTIPYAEVDGTISYPVFRATMDLPPTMSVAQILQLRLMAAQTIMDAELDNYYLYGTVA